MEAIQEKRLLGNPIRKSPLLGATIALEGIDKCLTLHHGPQGCTAFAKNFLTQHFREVMPMQTTALSDIATIMGDDANLYDALRTVITKHKPTLVAVVGSAVSETRGDDISGALKRWPKVAPEFSATPTLHIAAPDFNGDMEQGYCSALNQIVAKLVDDYQGEPCHDFIVVIPSVSLTPGDLRQIKRIVKAFGLKPLLLPDIAPAIGGANGNYSTLPQGGITLDEILKLSSYGNIITIGASVAEVGKNLQTKGNAALYQLDSVIGVLATDELVDICRTISKRSVPEELLEERQLAIDAMLDSHFYWGDKQVALAGEPDLVVSLGSFLSNELGVKLSAVVTTRQTAIPNIKSVVGDHDDLALLAKSADLMFGSTNAVNTARKLGVPLIRMGYPVKDYLGQHQECFVGYVGASFLAYKIGNIFLEQYEHHAHGA